jgi:hypothetical protein
MNACEPFQDQFLDYLYDLLDAPEKAALEAHVAVCPACQSALERARGQQKLLAAAARAEFPQVRFEAPAEAPATVPLAARPRPVRRWRRWAVAAAALIAVAGLGVPGYHVAAEYRTARRTVAQTQTALAEARARQVEAEARLAQLPQQTERKVAALIEEFQAKQLKLIVTGPKTVLPGAPAEYTVRTTDLNNRLTAAKVEAQVVDGTRPVGEPIEARTYAPGQHRLTLPPDLPLKPDSQLGVVMVAKRADGSRRPRSTSRTWRPTSRCTSPARSSASAR